MMVRILSFTSLWFRYVEINFSFLGWIGNLRILYRVVFIGKCFLSFEFVLGYSLLGEGNCLYVELGIDVRSRLRV